MSVRFSLLGPVRAWRGPVELDVGPKQPRAILALLLVRANQIVTLEDLIELLWEQNPPSSAVNIIHKYIAAIRRLIEPDLPSRASGRWIIRHGSGYQLIADEKMTDLLTFRRLVRDARSANAENWLGDAFELWISALDLWRGPCGEGLDLSGKNVAYFVSVNQEYLAALAEAVDVALANAQCARILPLLRPAALREPLDESLQARLILVLAAVGQQGAALAHYQAVHARLTDELGVDPGPEIRMAHSKVLRQDFPPSASSPSAGTPGNAPEPLAGKADSGASPSAPIPLVPPAQLPPDLPVFAGRHAELSKISGLLTTSGKVSSTVVITAIDGMAGIGKTTFAIHWAHTIAKDFKDGHLYINLRGFDTSDSVTAPADALRTLLYSLGVPADRIPDTLDARVGLYRSVLAGRRILIVLDNARNAEQVRPLLPGSPGCLVIVTSRNPLAGLVMTEGAQLITLNLPSALTARETLELRLGVTRVSAEPEAVEEIVHLCGRLPLALAIVSARAASHPDFTLASIAADLRRTKGRLDAFGTAGIAADARTAFSWSYQHLSSQASRLFRLLPLPPAADITAAVAASLLGVVPEEANHLIAELRDTSLITEHLPGRYSLHDLVRAYAMELSLSSDAEAERHQALGRVLDHYLQSSYAAQVVLKPHREPIPPAPPRRGVTPEQFADYESAMSWFTAERHVLNAAVPVAAGTDFGFPAWQLALTLQQFYQWRGFFHDWRQSMETALEASERYGDKEGQGHVLRSLAGAFYYVGRHEAAIRFLERAQAIYTELGYTTEHAYLHTSFAEVFTRQGKQELAIEHNRRALELYREAHYRRGEARAIADIGVALGDLGKYEEAVPSLEKGIALAQEVSNLHQEGKVHKDLGIVYTKTGQHDRAISEFRKALDLLRRVGHRPMEAETLSALGDALASHGDPVAACAEWQKAYEIFSAFRMSQKADITERLLRYGQTPARPDGALPTEPS